MWPDACCVAAFLWTALQELGFKIDKRSVASELGTSVPIGAANPWNLPEEKDAIKSGVSLEQAKEKIPQLLARLASNVQFHHLRVTEIPYGLYRELLLQLLSHGLIVAIGVDTLALEASPNPAQKWRHVLRIVDANPECLRIRDDSLGEFSGVRTLSWETVEAAIRRINDGFWVIGEESRFRSAVKTAMEGAK